VTAIERIDFTRSEADQAYVLDARGPRVMRQNFSSAPEVTWARDPANRGLIYQGPIEVVTHGKYHLPIMDLATPVYEESVDESHPKATGKLDGVLIFKIDVSIFAANYCAEIRSGRTGYCWVMDNKGIFLYHPEKEFIGQDAFTARGRRNPAISFAQINEIQKTKMLAGEEGKSRYISGWHRGVIRQMEKFVAFSHANVEPGGGRIWPVAVVAPTDEVYGTIHSLYVRQFLIQGILIFALICAAAAVSSPSTLCETRSAAVTVVAPVAFTVVPEVPVCRSLRFAETPEAPTVNAAKPASTTPSPSARLSPIVSVAIVVSEPAAGEATTVAERNTRPLRSIP